MAEKGATAGAGRFQLVGEKSGVTRLELFLDLIFVFAFLNVSGLTVAELDAKGLVHGLLLLALLWSCWISYAWLGNAVRVDRGIMPVLMFGLAAVILVLVAGLQEAFVDKPGGLFGPLVLAVCYLLIRFGALSLGAVAARPRPDRRQVLQAWTPLLVAGPLMLAAGLVPFPAGQSPASAEWVRFTLVLVAMVVEYVGAWTVAVSTWPIFSVKHWTERYHLIILVAFGEIIISIGTGQGVGLVGPITAVEVTGTVLSMLLVGVLWWTYFDIARLAAEDALEGASGAARSRLARDAYTLLHLPMIAGLILLSLGLKHAFNRLVFPLMPAKPGLGVFALFGGVVLYLLGLIAFERRAFGLLGRGPTTGVVLILALVPLALRVPVLVQLGLLAAGVASLVALDRTVFRGRHRALHRAIEPVAERFSGVTPKELFLDLVFVYAFLQVTALMTAEPSWRGLARGLAVLALLWWAWCCYAWLGSVVRSENAATRLVLLGAGAAILVIAIATQVVFSDRPGGLSGPLVFVVAYGVLRALHLGAFWVAARGNSALRRQLIRLGVPAAVALALLAVAAVVPPPSAEMESFQPARAALWLAAVTVDLGSGYLINARHWPVRSAEHWADRFGLIILVALGGAIIATGQSVGNRPVDVSLIVATVLGLLVVAALWWVYFDVDATAGQRGVQSLQGGRRSRMALEAYTYLHLFMVVGIVMVAFGLRETVAEIDRIPGPTGTALSHLTLYGGVIIYLIADAGFWWRVRHRVRPLRAIEILALIILALVTTWLPRLAGLALLGSGLGAFALAEAVRSAQLRRALRDPLVSPPPAR